MAVVGSAYVVVRAINTKVLPDIQKGLAGVPKLGQQAGAQLGQGISEGLGRSAFRAFNRLGKRLEASRVQFRRLNNAARFLGPAITGLAGIIGALGGGLIVLASAAAQASRALIVIPASFGALIQALGTTRFLLGGVSEAFQAKIQAQEQSGAANRAEEAALRRLNDAREDLKRLIEEEAPEELARARERAADAARSAADALLGAQRTQRSYNDAQRDSLDAIADLNDAREEAKEKLQQLRFELEGAAIGESRARLEFEKARDSLQAVQDLPPNSRARQEAELAFAEAELNLRKAIDNNADLKKEEDAATKAGVEGADEVVAAKRALADAQQREADLAIDTAKAFERAARAQEDAAQAAADAAAGGKVQQELNRRIEEARERVRLAEQAFQDAAAGGANALAEAYGKISEEGQEFVDTLDRVRKKLIDLRNESSGPLFIGLTSALETFEGALPALQPLIEETGAVVGNFADKLSTALFTGEGFDTLQSVFGNNNELLEDLGDTAVNLALALLEVLDAAEPIISAFGEWASSASAQLLANLRDDADGLQDRFQAAADRFGQIVDVVGTFFQALGVLGGVINQEGGAADTLLGGLQERANNFLTTLTEGAEDGSLNELFQGLSENFLLLFDAVSEIGGALLEIGASQGITDLLSSLTGEDGIIQKFKEIGLSLTEGPDSAVAGLAQVLDGVVTLIANLTESGAIEVFFETLTDILGVVNDITGSEAFQNILEAIGPLIAKIAAFGFAWRSVKFLLEALGGIFFTFILNPLVRILTIGALLGGAKGIGGGFLKAIGTALRFAGIIGAIIGIFIVLYANSEAFRTSIGALFGAIGAAIKGAIDNVNSTIQEVFPKFQGLGDLASTIFGGIGDFLSGTLIPIIGAVLSGAIGAIGGIIAGLVRFFGSFKKLFGAIGSYFQGIMALFKGDFEGAIGFFGDALKGFRDFFFELFKALVSPVVGLFNGIIDAWNNTAGKFSVKIPDWVPFIGGNEYTLKPIPRIKLAEGGIIPATPGGVLATIGEAGRPERVEPLDPDGLSRRDKAIIDRLSGGGAGATINVYPSEGMNERELADLVSRKLAYQMRKGAV